MSKLGKYTKNKIYVGNGLELIKDVPAESIDAISAAAKEIAAQQNLHADSSWVCEHGRYKMSCRECHPERTWVRTAPVGEHCVCGALLYHGNCPNRQCDRYPRR